MNEHRLIGALSLGAPAQKGPKGDRGPIGPQGPQGIQGIQGEKGERGEVGPRGIQGMPGPQGIQGIKGDQGPKGDIGPKGPKGDKGDQGVQGPQGAQGPRGIQGIKGDTGEQGPRGFDGFNGPIGPQGPQGRQGEQGPRGEIGPGFRLVGEANRKEDIREPKEQGDCYFITSTKEVVMWTGSKWVNFGVIKGPRGDQGPRGIEGPIGAQGPMGERGPIGERGEQGPKGDVGEAAIIDSKISNVNTWSSKHIIDHLLQDNEWKPVEGSEINDATNGYIKGLEIEGQTLKNICNINFNTGDGLGFVSMDRQDGYIIGRTGARLDQHLFTLPFKGLKPSTKYTIVYDIKEYTLKGDGANFNINLGGDQFEEIHTPISNFKSGINKFLLTSVADVNTKDTGLKMFYGGNVTSGQIIFRFYLLEGDYTKKDVPDFIEGVQGVGRKTKNLLNFNNIHDANGVKVINKGGIVEFEGLGINSRAQPYFIIDVKNMSKITIKGELIKNGAQFYLGVKDNEKGNNLYINYGHDIDHQKTFDVSNVNVIKVSMGKHKTDQPNLILKNIQLEQGDHATPYEPYYEGYKIGVKTHGKNLFNINDIQENKSVDDEGQIVGARDTITSNFIKIKSNTSYVTSVLSWGRISLYNDNKEFISNVKGGGNDTLKFNSSSGKYLLLTCNISSKNIQLEEGTHATSYQPYNEKTSEIILQDQLQGIGDIKDRLYFDEGYKVEKKIGKVKLLEEDVESHFILDDGKSNILYSTQKYINYKTYGKVESNILRALTTEEAKGLNNFKANTIGVRSYLVFGFEEGLTRQQRQEKIKEYIRNGLELFIELATPTTTDTQIKTELLPQTYKNKTYIDKDMGVSGAIKGEYAIDDFKKKIDDILLSHGLIKAPHTTLEELEEDEPTTLEEFQDEPTTLEGI